MDWTTHMENLTNWAADRGYHVEAVKNGDDSICHISKTIEINSSSKASIQIIRLLHECGHALIFDNGSNFNFKEKREYSKNTVAYKVFAVIEEVEAWKRGKELAKRLGIPIEEAEWEADMVRALKKYINWASDLKEKTDDTIRRSKSDKGNETRSKCRSSKEGASQ